MDIPILRELEKLVIEHGSAVIQEKHIALLKDHVGLLERQKEDLERENAKLSEELGTAKREVERHTIPSEYLEWQGVLIKRAPGAGYSDTPYCPMCKLPMSSTPPRAGHILICSHRGCEYISRVSIAGFRDQLRKLRGGT